MNTEMISEGIDGPSISFLMNEAERTGIPICGSVPAISVGSKNHIALVVAYPNNSMESYAKKHLFTFIKRTIIISRSWDTTLNIAGTAVGFFICFDLRFAPISGIWHRQQIYMLLLLIGLKLEHTIGNRYSLRAPLKIRLCDGGE